MRTMYDSVTASDIPTSAQMVAGYVSGRYAWSAAGWARFPNAVKVRIATQANVNDGHVLDCEPGDATPAQCPGWVQRRRAAGVDPSVYCNTSTWPAVRAAFRAAGVPEPHYWIASYPGIGPNLYPGSVAHQYADPVHSGGHYDLSVVADYWPGVDAGQILVGSHAGVPVPINIPTPTPAPLPASARTNASSEDDMTALIVWFYEHLLGRGPSTGEVLDRVGDFTGWSATQVRDWFLASRAEPGTVKVAFQEFLGHDPNSDQVAQWSAGQTVRQVRDGIAGSPEALARR